MELSRTACSECGYAYPEEETPPCPYCGGTARTYSVHATGVIRLYGGLRVRHERDGFRLLDSVTRYKFSRSGNLAHESLTFDRSDAAETVKRHVVKEEQPDGSWDVVHDERETFPAKRRPSSDY